VELVVNALWVGSSAGQSGLVRVKLGDHFTKFLSDQQRRGECHKRSPLVVQAFASRASRPKLPSLRFGLEATDPIEGGVLGTDEVVSLSSWRQARPVKFT
jgi:hypothetical protein